MKQKNWGYIYFGTFILFAALLAFLINNKKGGVEHISDKKIVAGVLDLSDIGSLDNKVVYLQGESEFYFNEYYFPSYFDSNTIIPQYIKIPGTWNKTTNKSEGIATYRFRVKVSENGWYGLKIAEFDCAYKLFINGKFLQSAGNPGVNYSSTIPSWARKEAYFEIDNKVADIVIHLANFHHRKGGAEDIMVFGKADDIIAFKTHQKAIEFFILGVILIMVVYHLGLFLMRSDEKADLLFSLIALTFGLRLMFSGEKLFFDLFPNFPWEPAVKLEYLTFIWPMTIILLFIREFYKKLVSPLVIKAAIIITLAISFVVVVFPASIYSYIPDYFQFVVVLLGFYIVFTMGKALKLKKEYAFMIFMGLLFFYMISIAEMLNYNKITQSGQVLHFGMFAFIFSQSYVLSMRYTKIYNINEQLTNSLKQYSRKLEGEVGKRTAKIQAQAKELEESIEELKQKNLKLAELDEFKNSMTSMLVHDLKNPLNLVLNLSKEEISQEKLQQIEQSGKHMLNLILNMLDVEKYEHSSLLLKKTQFPYLDVIKKATEQTEFLFSKKNIHLDISIPNDFMIIADRSLIERVLINLLSNAAKFTPINGNVKIMVQMDRNGFCITKVIDSGPGIPADKKELIFSKFGQITAKDSGRSRSTGLGLTFCKMAVEAHDGEIDVNSSNKGATFWFTIPCKVTLPEDEFRLSNKNEFDMPQNIITTEEIQYLIPYCKELQLLDVYELSAIKKVLKQIELSSEPVNQWKEKIENSVKNINESSYKSLIQDILGNGQK